MNGPHITGAFSVFSNDDTLEIVGVQSGPAGSVGATLDEGIDIDIDGADPSQMNAVRVWIDSTITPVQEGILEELFGHHVEEIVGAVGATQPVRVAGEHLSMQSRPRDMVSMDLQMHVQAVDALSRIETTEHVAPLLRLVTAVSSHVVGATCEVPSIEEITFAAQGLDRGAYTHLTHILEEAERRGLITRNEMGAVLAGVDEPMGAVAFSGVRQPLEVWDEASESVIYHAHVMRSAGDRVVHRPSVVVDPSSVYANNVDVRWAYDGNIAVMVRGVWDSSVHLWARARHDGDGTIVAAAPLVVNDTGMYALLLVAERDHVVIDVVSHVGDRVIDANVGALARAYDAGRAAARLERLGRENDADVAWRECARQHQLAGDLQREKMALSRRQLRAGWAPATLLDHLL